MGVSVENVPDVAQQYGVSAGAVVKSVVSGSAAEKAGLHAEDIIISVDSTAIDTASALTAALSANYKAGDTAKLTVIRSNTEITLTITFDEKTNETTAAAVEEQQTQQEIQIPSGSTFPFGR